MGGLFGEPVGPDPSVFATVYFLPTTTIGVFFRSNAFIKTCIMCIKTCTRQILEIEDDNGNSVAIGVCVFDCLLMVSCCIP